MAVRYGVGGRAVKGGCFIACRESQSLFISKDMSALRLPSILGVIALLIAVVLVQPVAEPVRAQDRETPYWASLKFDKVNMRVGPSREYPIDWVYQRKGLPVKVVRLREEWRLVQDHEGTQGWVSRSQLTEARGAMVTGKGEVELREDASAGSTLRWRAQPGVVGKLLRCRDDWCEIDIDGKSGWVLAARLWGAGEP